MSGSDGTDGVAGVADGGTGAAALAFEASTSCACFARARMSALSMQSSAERPALATIAFSCATESVVTSTVMSGSGADGGASTFFSG